MEQVRVVFRGPLRILAADGRDYTPRSARARALVALLAATPGQQRSRRWVETLLWGNKSSDKASMSLRQILTEIRNSLSDFHGLLRADRHTVWLDSSLFLTDLDTGAGDQSDADILEGMDIGEPDFEEWLCQLRASANRSLLEAGVPHDCLRVVARIGESSGPAARITAGLLADQISRNLEDGLGGIRATQAVGSNDIEIIANTSEDSSHALISARVVHLPSDRVLFSGFRSLRVETGRPAISDESIAAFAHEAAARAVALLPQAATPDNDDVVAIGLAEAGKRLLFTYDPATLGKADDLFRRAYDADPNGLYLAWRAFHRTTQVIEGLVDATPELRQETESYLRRAVELSGENAQVHALVALVRLLMFNDAEAGLNAAEAGLRRNPHGLFVRQAYAMTVGAFGDWERAYRASSFCRPALEGEDARHLWDLYHGLVCIGTRRWEEARTALQQALRRCPTFKAPHRQLIALSLHLGDTEAASRHLSAMRRLEPGFDLERYVSDPDYPATTLRSAGLLAQPFADLLADPQKTERHAVPRP